MERKSKKYGLILIKSQNLKNRLLDVLISSMDFNIEQAFTTEELKEKLLSDKFKFEVVFVDADQNIQDFPELFEAKQLVSKTIVVVEKATPETTVDKLKELGFPYLKKRVELKPEVIPELVGGILGKGESKETYRRIVLLGEGVSGQVYKVIDTRTDEAKAHKVIDMKTYPEAMREKMRQEVKLMQEGDSPFVIKLFDSIELNEVLNIYMELAEKGTLSMVINKHKLAGNFIEDALVFDYFCQILCGIAFLHKKNIMHRDIKPDNILIRNNDAAKLADLGIARVADENNTAGTFAGTPYYLAPEINEDPDNKYTNKVDVWSLGVILYEMCFNKKPFYDDDVIQLRQCILKKQYKPFTRKIDGRLEYLINLLLIKDPNNRPSSHDLLMIDFIWENVERLSNKFDWNIEKIPICMDICNSQKVSVYKFIKHLEQPSKISLLMDAMQIDTVTIRAPYKSGFLSSSINHAFQGENVLLATEETVGEEAKSRIEEMLESGLLVPLSISEAVYDDSAYYAFSFNNTSNNEMNPPIFKEFGCPSSVSLDTLVKFSTFCLDKCLREVNAEDKITLETLAANENYAKFRLAVSQFEQLEVLAVPEELREAMMLNLYQIMMIHFYLLIQVQNSGNSGIMSLFKNEHHITYKFKDFSLSDIEVKNVVFRNNKKPVNNYLKLVSDGTEKTKILPGYDWPLILLFLLDLEDDPEKFAVDRFFIQVYEQNKLEKQKTEYLEFVAENFASFEEDSVTLPECLKKYESDFGSRQAILEAFKKAGADSETIKSCLEDLSTDAEIDFAD